MNENKDSRPVDGKYAGQAKPRNGRPRGCRAITEAGEICGETESLEIIEKFHKLYEERLRMVDDVPGIKDRTRLKVQILSSWVNDLAEQNAMLVKTVEQLEVEATSRVALLEERLQQSSHVALKYMSKLQDCDGRLRGTARETNQSELLKMSEECLRKRIASLQNDMLGLTELIRRAYCDGSWNIDGLNFCEITYEDIFGHSPSKNVVLLQEKCSLEQAGKEEVHSNLAQKKKDAVQKIAVNIKTESSTRSHREKDDDSKCGAITTTATTTTTDNSADLDSAPPKIHTAEYEMQRELNHAKSITKDKIEISKLTTQLEETEAKLEARILEVSTLSSKLKEKNEKIRILTEKLGDAEESCTSIKDSWKAELAKQNEETLSLKQDLQCLEDSVQQANVHTSLKDDIIKEMRKDLKLTRIKDGYQDLADMKSSLSEISTNLQASWGQICSVFKDIPQDYIMRHTDLMEREQCVVKLLLEKLEAVGNDLELQSKMKKGVNFASVSIEEHEKKIEELQKKLKDAQKEVQTVEINGDSLLHAGIHLSKEIAEYRVKVVIAQAALEEMKDEVDILLDNLQKRENKLMAVEDLIHRLLDALRLFQNDVELVSQASYLQTSVGADGNNMAQKTDLNDLLSILEAADVHPEIGLLCAEASNHEGKCAVKNVKTCEEAMKKISAFIENFEIREEKILVKQNAMDSLKDNLKKIQLVLKDLQEKVFEYSVEKEVSKLSCINSEIKIQKLQQELESVQDDLEHYIEALQPANESASDSE